MTKTSKCEHAKGQCTAASDSLCRKKRMKRVMTALCFKMPVVEEQNVQQM